MELAEWQQQQAQKRMTPVIHFVEDLEPDRLHKALFEDLDITALRLYPRDSRVQKIVRAADKLVRDCRIRQGERAPRIKKGKGAMVKAARHAAACKIATIK